MKRPYQNFSHMDLQIRKLEIEFDLNQEELFKINKEPFDKSVIDWCKINLKQIQNELNYRAELNAV